MKTARSTGLLGAGVLVLAALALAACSSSPASAPSSTAGASASSGADSSGASNSAGSSSLPEFPTTTPTSVPDCVNGQITVTYTAPPGGGAAGHTGVVMLFTNSSAAPCVLLGYPGVDGLDSSGHAIAHASRTLNGMIGFCHCTKPASLTLKPNDVVSAVVEGAISGGADCSPFASMLVTPPNTSLSTPIPTSPDACGFTVHPVVTGTAGQAA